MEGVDHGLDSTIALPGETGVVTSAELPAGKRLDRDLPYNFYYITERVCDLLDRSDVLDKGVWRDTYTQVKKSEDIERYEEVTRL